MKNTDGVRSSGGIVVYVGAVNGAAAKWQVKWKVSGSTSLNVVHYNRVRIVIFGRDGMNQRFCHGDSLQTKIFRPREWLATIFFLKEPFILDGSPATENKFG